MAKTDNKMKSEETKKKLEDYPELQENEKRFIRVPKKIIFDGEYEYDKYNDIVCDENGEPIWNSLGLGKRRMGVFLYLFCKMSYDMEIFVSLKLLCDWLHKDVDVNRKNSGNQDLIRLFGEYEKMGLIDIDKDEIKVTKIVEGKVNKSKLDDMCNGKDRFAILYIDEIKKILDYDGEVQLDKWYVLLVFAYFRLMIPCQGDFYGAAEIAEAFDIHYRQIEDEFKLSERIVSKAVAILVELGILYERRRSPVAKYFYEGNKKVKKLIPRTSIFCNVYKRKDGRLIGYGEDYYEEEIKKKIEILNREGYR